MKKIIIAVLFAYVLIISSYAYGDASQVLTFNTTQSDVNKNLSDTSYSANVRVQEIRQDPFPVNPGEYVDIYMKLENNGQAITNPRFDLILKYPFTLDASSSDVNSNLLSIDTGEKRTLHYKVRVDSLALPGNYEIEYRAYNSQSIYYPYFFKIKVADVTSSFDVAVQDISKNGVTIGISNTGTTNAQSITMRLDKQTDFTNFGYNSYIIGNLNSGDDTSVEINVLPKDYTNGKDYTLKLFIDYTDVNGYRRTAEKNIVLTMNNHLKLGFDELSNDIYNNTSSSKNGSSSVVWIILIAIVAIVLFFFFRRRRKKAK